MGVGVASATPTLRILKSGVGLLPTPTPTPTPTLALAFASICSTSDSGRMSASASASGDIGERVGEIEIESKKGAGAGAGAGGDTDDVVVQYVVLRRDLVETWPLGSVVTQGCHASVAAIWEHKDDPHTLLYCSTSNLHSMHKVTLEVKGESQILNLSEKLKASGISHKLWIEQPENFPTCLATKPYPKSLVSSFFKKLKLCK